MKALRFSICLALVVLPAKFLAADVEHATGAGSLREPTENAITAQADAPSSSSSSSTPVGATYTPTPKPTGRSTPSNVFVVTSTSDSSTANGSLRWAINQVNDLKNGGAIYFDPSLAGKTIALGVTILPDITKNCVIEGNGVRITHAANKAEGILGFSGAIAVTVRRVYFSKIGQNNIGIKFDSNVTSLTVESCIFSGGDEAIYTTTSSVATSLSVMGCTFYNTQQGISAEAWKNLTVVGNVFYNAVSAFDPDRPAPSAKGAITVQNNVYRDAGSYSFDATNKQVASLPFDATTLRPTDEITLELLPTPLPSGYPAVDFYGQAISADGKVGAVQEVSGGGMESYVFEVSNTTDNADNVGSLRWAINQVNALAAGDATIYVATSLAGKTITLTSQLPEIAESCYIEGNGIKISGDGKYRIMNIWPNRPAINVIINRVHFLNGRDSGNGSAIRKGRQDYEDYLTLNSCIFSNNQKSAVYTEYGMLNVQGCTFYDNYGAISRSRGNFYLTGNIFYENQQSSSSTISGGVTTSGYNVYDEKCDNVFDGTDNKMVISQSFDAATFNVADFVVKMLPASLPIGYPTKDFYGNAIYGRGMVGAVQQAQIPSPPAATPVFEVTTTADDAYNPPKGSLRWAINQVNAQSKNGAIFVKPSLAGQTIVITSMMSIISKSCLLEGNGIKISLKGTPQAMTIAKSATSATINRVHFLNGSVYGGDGAAVRSFTALTLNSCIFSDNLTTDGVYARGGAIYADEAPLLNVQGCTFYSNNTEGYGGAICLSMSTVNLAGNIFYGNTAIRGGNTIYSFSGSVGTKGYNAYDNTSNFSFGGTGDKQVTSQPFSTGTFLPTMASVKTLPPSLPKGYPTRDYYGHSISGGGYAGAVQTSASFSGDIGYFEVTNTNNAGEGSLRQAIINANGYTNAVISFNPSVARRTITISSVLPDITKNVTIDGYGITISGDYKCQIMVVNASGITVTVRGVHFTRSQSGDYGALRNQGTGSTLNVESCIFSNNSTTGTGSSGRGAALFNQGTLNVRGSTFYGNKASRFGGVIYNLAGAATFTGNIFYGNGAGANSSTANSSTAYCAGGTVTSGGYNVYYNTGGLAVTATDKQVSQLAFDAAFAPVGNSTMILSNPLPAGYPVKDFYGIPTSIASYSYAGAVQNLQQQFAVPPAQDLQVTTTADAGAGSLREAINAANTLAGTPTITFQPQLRGKTLTLLSPLPAITKDCLIEGNGVKISGNGKYRILQAGNIDSSSPIVTINRVHFLNGYAADYGGAVRSYGKLKLNSCILSGNRAAGENAGGGAIYTSAWASVRGLYVQGCTFYNNASAGSGGAIYRNGSCSVSLTGNIFYGNAAGSADKGHTVYVDGSAAGVSGAYNVYDNTSSYAFDGTGNRQVASQSFNLITFTPTANEVKVLPASLPSGYPTKDFYGAPITGNGAAGAVQADATTSPTPSSVFVVTSNSGSSTDSGSLRWAINQVNDLPGGGAVYFDPSLAGQTIALGTNTLPDITQNCVIEGNSVKITHAATNADGIFSLGGAIAVTVRRIHFSKGSDYSIGIKFGSDVTSLTVESCIFSGGDEAIYTASTASTSLFVMGCTFYSNQQGISVGTCQSLTVIGNVFQNTFGAFEHTPLTNGATTIQYNTYSKMGNHSFDGTNKQVTSLPFDVTTFNPTDESTLKLLPTPLLSGYPAVDFYGQAISAGGKAGAVQAVQAASGGGGTPSSVFAVTSNSGSSTESGTLRWAINQVNTREDGGIIYFDPSLASQTIALGSNILPSITKNCVIEGNGVTITHTATNADGIFNLSKTTTVTVRRVHFSKGSKSSTGIRFVPSVSLTVESCVFSGGNEAIYSTATFTSTASLSVMGCTFYNNQQGISAGRCQKLTAIGNVFYNTLGAFERPPLTNGATTIQYNTYSKMGSHSFDTTNKQVTSLPFDVTTFNPTDESTLKLLPTPLLSGYPAVDFYGQAISADGKAGAVQAVSGPITYTVRYLGNGAEVKGATASSIHAYGVAAALSANGYSRAGYRFWRWSDAPDGTGAIYPDGATVTDLSSALVDTVRLYAQWRRVVKFPDAAIAAKIYDGTATATVTSVSMLYEDNAFAKGELTLGAGYTATAQFLPAQPGGNAAAAGVGRRVEVAVKLADTSTYILQNAVYTIENQEIKARVVEISGTKVQRQKVYDGSDSAHVTVPGSITNKVGDDDISFAATAAYSDALVGENKIITVTYALTGGADKGSYVAPGNDTVRDGAIFAPAFNNPDSADYHRCDKNNVGPGGGCDDDGDGIPNINDPDSDSYHQPDGGGDTGYCGKDVLNVNCPSYPGYNKPGGGGADDDQDGIPNINDPDSDCYHKPGGGGDSNYCGEKS